MTEGVFAMKRTSFISQCLVFFLCAIAAYSALPTSITYQGRLLEGTSLINGNTNIQFRIWDDPTAGTMLYSETNAVTCNDGLFSTTVGDDDPSAFVQALRNGAVWLEVLVGGASMGSRERLLAVPYAMNAINADSAQILQKETMTGIRMIATTNALGDEAPMVIIGADDNSISNTAFGSSIGGGQINSIGASSTYAVVSGGIANTIKGISTQNAIGGGNSNMIDNSTTSTIGGGDHNIISNACTYSVIFGGQDNIINESRWSVIAGGSRSYCKSDYSFAAGRRAHAKYDGCFVWADSQNSEFESTTDDEVSFRCEGGVRFTSGSGSADQTVAWEPGDSSWTFSSDRALKENFIPVNKQDILEKVASIPMRSWNFTGYDTRHIGPMAQDFHAAFGLGKCDTRIDSADLQGVTIVSIQHLYAIVQEQQKIIEQLQVELNKLKSPSH